MYHTLHACVHDQLCLTPCDPLDCTHQTPLFMEFSRQEHWSGVPFPALGDLPDPGMELKSSASPALASRFFITAPPEKHTGSGVFA